MSHGCRVSARSFTEWVLDLAAGVLGLLAVPLLVGVVVLTLMDSLWPSPRALLVVPGWVGFLLSFVVLDYVQYWGHRCWHSESLWPVHFLHHTLARMDGVGALRHSVWDHVFNPAIWINGILLYLLADRSWYLIGLSTSLILEVWRHSTLPSQAQHGLARLLRRIVVTPEVHAMHHAEREPPVNFGNNLIIWDQWHGTYAAPALERIALGVPLPSRPLGLLVWPARTPAPGFAERDRIVSRIHAR